MGLSTDLINPFFCFTFPSTQHQFFWKLNLFIHFESVLDEFQIRNLWTNLWEDHPSTPPRETGLFLNQLAQLVCSGHMTMRWLPLIGRTTGVPVQQSFPGACYHGNLTRAESHLHVVWFALRTTNQERNGKMVHAQPCIYQVTFEMKGPLQCESENREHWFDFHIKSDMKAKTNYRYWLQSSFLAHDWLFTWNNNFHK